MNDDARRPAAPGEPAPQEPALRPRADRGPGVELSRRARLFVEGDELVLRGRSGTRRRLRIGGKGSSDTSDGGAISRAVFIDVPRPDAERMGPPVRGSWGELQLQNGEGELIAALDLDDWLPESGELPKRYVQGEQLLARTGAAGLLAAAGIPLHTVRDENDPLVDRRTRAPRLTPGSTFPVWYWTVRGAAAFVWFAAFTVLVFSGADTPWLVLVSAAAALTAPVARLALRAWTRLRLRRGVPAVVARIVPCPAPGAGATVRFRRATELRVQDRDLVLKDLAGQEHWLARRGPHAVTSLVLVRDRAGAPVGVELRGPDRQIRAVLPWDQWFGGDSAGRDGWAALQRAMGLTATERRLTGRADWPKGPALGLRMLPASAREARAMSRFPGTLVGVSSTAVMAVGAFFSVAQGTRLIDAHPAAAWAAMAMGGAAGLLQALPYAIHQVRSRCRLDRQARQQETSS
ncbi:hypothetical protein ACFWZ2_23435 [Streptomyces sp. NPDC059002]|uniref:hypothetical protein n=1 Tax=Streptomyces sp. NPDC059002 TaxID=3346690 RepID=UPI0036C63AB7